MDILKEQLKEKITSVVNDIEQTLPKKDVISLLKELSFYFDMKADEVEKDLNENGERTFENLRVNQLKPVSASKCVNNRYRVVTQNNDGWSYQEDKCCEANDACCEVDDTCCDSDYIARGSING